MEITDSVLFDNIREWGPIDVAAVLFLLLPASRFWIGAGRRAMKRAFMALHWIMKLPEEIIRSLLWWRQKPLAVIYHIGPLNHRDEGDSHREFSMTARVSVHSRSPGITIFQPSHLSLEIRQRLSLLEVPSVRLDAEGYDHGVSLDAGEEWGPREVEFSNNVYVGDRLAPLVDSAKPYKVRLTPVPAFISVSRRRDTAVNLVPASHSWLL